MMCCTICTIRQAQYLQPGHSVCAGCIDHLQAMQCIECGSVRHFEESLHLMQCPCYDNEDASLSSDSSSEDDDDDDGDGDGDDDDDDDELW